MSEKNSAKSYAQNRLNDLINNGKLFSGVTGNSINGDLLAPVWFDEIKYNRAQQLARKYYFSLTFGQFIGLLFLLYNRELAAPLVATGNSSTVSKLFNRYISTFAQIKLWYEHKPFDKSSKSYLSLLKVRAMHKHTADIMITKHNSTDNHSKHWISQYSMAQTQFAFVGLVTLFPQHCGLHSLSNQDLDCLLFFWRTIGYCLGIDDRFNVCAGSVDEVKELFALIFWKEWQPIISGDIAPSKEGVCMSKGICLFTGYWSRISWNVVTRYWYPIMSVNENVLLTGLADYIAYYVMVLLLKYLLVCSLINWFVCTVMRLRLWYALRYRERLAKRLDSAFKRSIFDEQSTVQSLNNKV